jgi:hypothetical protein
MTTAIRIIISSNPDNLNVLSEKTTFAAVEAEYGSREVKGSSDLLTLNHHVRTERPCPCSLSNDRFDDVREEIEVIGISHMDLDTLGGIAALLGVKPESPTPGFWEMAEFVDTKGPHRIRECSSYNAASHVLLASFWAWSQQNRLFPERDGSVSDVTEYVTGAIVELERILGEDANALTRGQNFLEKEDALKAESFVRDGVSESGLRVVLRESDGFVNHLYYDENGNPVDVVVGFNSKFKSVTVSRADDSVGVVAKTFVQELWGELAGGHPGIAGSPRGEELELSEAERAFEALMAR